MDTLRFDTVFTTRGSATRIIKAYNPGNRPVLIDEIFLEGAPTSNYRLNIDGTAATSVQDVVIQPDDSLYVFVEVNIDPTNSNNALIVEDKVHFQTAARDQFVVLEAFGQDANYVGSKAGLSALTCNMGTEIWDDPRPYVVYGVLFVDSCILNIKPGVRINVHGGFVPNSGQPYNDGLLYFLENGKLKIEGTVDNPVVIEDDRLEPEFDDLPGQWSGIVFGPMSGTHEMEHAVVRNSIIGVRVDSAASLNMNKCIINNTLSSNIIGYHCGMIQATNSLFHSSSSGNNFQMEYGGNAQFDYCTFATYSQAQYISHEQPSVRISDYWCYDDFLSCQVLSTNPVNAQFTNCIIYGTLQDELQIDERFTDASSMNFKFDYCLIRATETDVTDASKFVSCIINEPPMFLDIRELDYHLDTLSAAEEAALPLPSITDDLDGNMRDATNPDIGCYEYQD